MKFLIIGHSVEDHVLSGEKEEIKPGGIYYTASALNSLKEEEDEIILHTAIERNNYNLFSSLYDNFKNDYFENVDAMPKVFLSITDNNERDECYNSISKNLNINLSGIDSFDGIIINMITGYDINVEQLKDLRNYYKGLIYFDVHTLSRGFESDGKRNFRLIPGFTEWAKMIDIIQVNQNELQTLSSSTEPLKIVKEILGSGTKYLILTMEDLGARVFYLTGNEVNSIFKPAIKIKAVNKIGCGDFFGAAFFYSYFKYRDIVKSMEFANIAAGLAASYIDLSEIKTLREDVFARLN
jgi:sugar/nucleoside kinase (ribokinase family)